MSFIALIVKNLVRQRVRTGLTVLGISIGITTVVALGVVTSGFKGTAGEILRMGGADFTVAQEGAADFSFSTVSEKDWQALSERSDVALAEGALFHIISVGSNPFFMLVGRDQEALARNPPLLVAGSIWEPGASNDVLLGVNAAKDLGVAPGDNVTIEHREFRVSGIYRTGRLYEDGGAFAPLPTVQEMAAKTGVVTAVYITVQPGVDPQAVAMSIEENFPNLVTMSAIADFGKVDQGIRVLDAANLAISVLAVGIGAIGVMNTMIMSVFERTREIGIMRAVGWSGGRVIRMIISESLILCVAGAVVGIALGVLATQAILLIDTVRTLLEPQYGLAVFVRALGVAVVVSLAGAAYPAIRAARLTPMEALRYE